ncbi:NTP transferase domain-containing protein [Acetobacter lambici]|uniref:NTP transferase domain-containing protein n=1 Tax=Acetobacter lambici TaxID=1332824 RepID=A0ABT1EXZ5_9PROT|nr:NTP transferase domain-containing protein [Acetobacter lambici]MCP1241700.1 NTP transferase domain-containing protein [Acetobacter lambici]MCP1257825.1 NTP transferase domain-containing protein [Acetobacter lambici]NHO56534.1 NTP transferase domain-containing protein [Acetobacter lambici]
MQPLHVIVQAGGRGSRLRHHTWNKPKCLVSVNGKPILYHLFDRFPDAHFVIIGDYLHEQLKKYLQINPPDVPYKLVQASGKGTLSGVSQALDYIPAQAPLVLTWSDLIIGNLPPWPQTDLPVVCTTDSFTCRWTVAPDGTFHEQVGSKDGIPGMFYFSHASAFPKPPVQGEFMKWFAANVKLSVLLNCPDMEELGEFSSIEESNDRAGFCRFFNKVEIKETQVIKTVVDPQYNSLHEKEIAWYSAAQALGFRRIPKIFSKNPLVLERISGQHAYDIKDFTKRERRAVMADYLDSLIALHELDRAPANAGAVKEVYLNKTVQRVESVSDIIIGFENDTMTINGRKCRNVFSIKYMGILQSILHELAVEEFVPIHGDATFSNTLIDDKLRVWFIDPRGYFDKPGIMGDAWYDFAKVYYSAVGGYDFFNRRKFKLHIDHETVEVLMEESSFYETAQEIFAEYFGKDLARIKILHGLIWLSFSGYAKDDIDSVMGSFYMGLYWLEDGLSAL